MHSVAGPFEPRRARERNGYSCAEPSYMYPVAVDVA